ncbi:MAG: hypothetical protein GEEBNDBF_01935 [bacterium]|nr:hypothetical protein [bacterium]
MSEVTIRLEVEALEEGGYVATSPDVPGLVVEAESIRGIAKLAPDIARLIYESCVENNLPIPPALRPLDAPSPKIMLTIPVGVD